MSDVLSDPLDRAQIELLLSLDDGDGAALLEIVDEYLAMSEEGRWSSSDASGQATPRVPNGPPTR